LPAQIAKLGSKVAKSPTLTFPPPSSPFAPISIYIESISSHLVVFTPLEQVDRLETNHPRHTFFTHTTAFPSSTAASKPPMGLNFKRPWLLISEIIKPTSSI